LSPNSSWKGSLCCGIGAKKGKKASRDWYSILDLRRGGGKKKKWILFFISSNASGGGTRGGGEKNSGRHLQRQEGKKEGIAPAFSLVWGIHRLGKKGARKKRETENRSSSFQSFFPRRKGGRGPFGLIFCPTTASEGRNRDPKLEKKKERKKQTGGYETLLSFFRLEEGGKEGRCRCNPFSISKGHQPLGR